MKRKKIYYNEEKNVDELKKKTPRGTCRHTGTSWLSKAKRLKSEKERSQLCSLQKKNRITPSCVL
jgi:hypothetical protein